MNITVKDVVSDSPVSGVSVFVDGSSAGTTNSLGQITGASSGTLVEVVDKIKVEYLGVDDREIWIDNSSSISPPIGP